MRTWCLIFLLMTSAVAYSDPLERVAFYYGQNIPINSLHAFQVVVVAPTEQFDPIKFNTPNSEAYAYVSLGESDREKKNFSAIKKTWILSENKAWHSVIMDQTQSAWRDYVLNQIIGPLWKAGYRGFFLDTLDAYEGANLNPENRAKQKEGMITLIKSIKEKYPTAKLIFNRGFDLLPSLHQDVNGFAVESLFQGYSKRQEKYQSVSEADRTWLLKKLEMVKQWKIPIIAIDYVPSDKPELSLAVAKKISALGFIPWVSVPDLDAIGVGNIVIQPRTILIIYDNQKDNEDDRTSKFDLLAMPLEFLGYTPKFIELNEALPQYPLQHRVAGVIFWLRQENYARMAQIFPWIENVKTQKIPVIFLNYFGVANHRELLQDFGVHLQNSESLNTKPAIVKQTDMMNFEASIIPSSRDFTPIEAESGEVQLELKSAGNKISEQVAIMPWGAYAVNDTIFRVLPNELNRWLLDPFKFFTKALHASFTAIPDVTTENGLRIMISQIDGDGFNNKAEWLDGPIAADIINQEIFNHYKIPITVSIVQGELQSPKLNDAQMSYDVQLAQKIFDKPWIEIATHTFSHPFDWVKVFDPKDGYKYRLPVRGNYHFNLESEITGSAAFINKELAPKGKRCKVLLWSGEANPPPAALRIADQDGLLNMNGGLTKITEANKSLTAIGPLGTWRGPYFQVYAPVTNENMYTNYWRGPFWGYRGVIQTFELTNSPRRYKPIDIYFHYYAGSKLASLNALKTVFDWSLSQNINPILASDYIRKVLNFNRITEAYDLEGRLHLYNIENLREFRLDKKSGYPEISEKNNVIGYSDFNDSRYIHLGPKSEASIILSKNPSTGMYLVSANAGVTEFHTEKNCSEISFKGYVPIQFSLANIRACKVTFGTKLLNGDKPINNVTTYHLGSNNAEKIRVCC